MAMDLVGPGSVDLGLSYFNATMWVGGVVGFAGAGLALEGLGPALTFYTGAALFAGASLLLFRLPLGPSQGAKPGAVPAARER